MVSDSKPGPRASVTADDLDAWRTEVTEIGPKMLALENRRALLLTRISAATALFDLLDDTRVEAVRADLGSFGSASTPKPRNYGHLTFVEGVRAEVSGSPQGGIRSRMLKENLEKGELGDKLRVSDKGFYHAISRLIERGEIKRYEGWLVDAARFDSFIEALARGEVEENVEVGSTGSRMGNHIIALLGEVGPQASKDLIDYLRKVPEFSESVSRNSTAAYNVLSRLVGRGKLKKDGLIYSLPDNEEAPAEATEASLFA